MSGAGEEGAEAVGGAAPGRDQERGLFDWPGLMRAGMRAAALGGLGLRPGEFWRLSPAELALMLGREAGGSPAGAPLGAPLGSAAGPMKREALVALMARWPDAGPDAGKDRGDG